MQKYFYIIFPFLIGLTISKGQSFTRISTGTQGVITPNLDDYWTGTAFVDLDNDLDLDIIMTNRIPGPSTRTNRFYENNNGLFISNNNLISSLAGNWFGVSCADFNNDDKTDCLISGYPSALFKNTGNLNFLKESGSNLGSCSFSGISGAFADLNNDGNLDFISVRPNWLQGPPCAGNPGGPHLMINDGPPNYSFTRLLDTTLMSFGSDTYLHPYFTDFDDDGDQDLLIGMGAGFSQPDIVLRNKHSETGSLTFEKITDQIFALDSVEGNQWIFIDVDNDLDLDAYVTNWANAVSGQNLPRTNNLYLNNNGVYNKVLNDPIVQYPSLSNSSLWGDLDNDADLDCIIVSDYNYPLKYFQNNGDGTFIEDSIPGLSSLDLHNGGGSVGDIDGDGDLDVLIPGPADSTAFLRNDLANGNHWIKFRLKGTLSNRSGIGAKLLITSSNSMSSLIQRRDFQSSDVFFGQNSDEIHFGLGSHNSIDSLMVYWPSGHIDVFDSLNVDSMYVLLENQSVVSNNQKFQISPPLIYPIPSPGNISIDFISIQEIQKARLEIINTQGKSVLIDTIDEIKMGQNHIKFDAGHLSKGSYILILRTDEKKLLHKKIQFE